MRRYQVYLNPQSVQIIDQFEKETNLSRSRIIRQATDSLAENLVKLMNNKKKIQPKGVLDSLVGIINIKGKKQTNFAEKVDEIYFKD